MKKNKYKQEKSLGELGSEFFIDLSKLTFAGVVLGAILKTDTDNTSLIGWGLVAFAVFAMIGVGILKLKK